MEVSRSGKGPVLSGKISRTRRSVVFLEHGVAKSSTVQTPKLSPQSGNDALIQKLSYT